MNQEQRDIIASSYRTLLYEEGQIEDSFEICKDLIESLRKTNKKLDVDLTEIDNNNHV